MNQVRVRFAPSPTGYLHIGGARTAIFNWLYARHYAGKFLLRIEDTDAQRSSDLMVDQIKNSLSILGINPDETVYTQSHHREDHVAVATQLLDAGKAYRCFCKPEILKKKKQEAIQNKRSDKYDRTCLKLHPDEIQQKLNRQIPYVVRLKVVEGKTVFNDGVLGKIQIQNSDIDDFIILRSDGTPVYQLAVVVDDHQMGISHVIRGNDHLSNTAKQIQIYHAKNWTIPHFVHLPLIFGNDNKRLSKRHGAVSVEAFLRNGILPHALFNYLSLLGWTAPDEREILTKAELIQNFNLSGINKKSAIFNEKKMLWMNGEYISRLTDEEILQLLRQNGNMIKNEIKNEPYVMKVISLLKSRLKTLNEFYERGFYFFKAPDRFDEKAIKKHFKDPSILDGLKKLVMLWKKNQWKDPFSLETDLRNVAEELGIAAGKLIHPVRLMVTGGTVSPSLFEMLYVIGKYEVINRIEWVLKNYNTGIKFYTNVKNNENKVFK